MKVLKNKTIFNEIKKIFLLLISLFLFLFLWSNTTKFYPENIFLWLKSTVFLLKLNNKNACEFSSNNIIKHNCGMINKNPVILTDNSFIIFNNSGRILRNNKHNFNNPCLKISGLRAIIYDIGGKNLKIENICENTLNLNTDKNIISCNIAENGTYGILTDSQSYLSELKIFNNKNVEKYSYFFSEDYICDFDIDDTGEHGICCGISSGSGNINSFIYLLDFKQENFKYKTKLDDNIVYKIKYLNNSNIIIIGSNYLSILNKDFKSIKKYDFCNKFVKFYDIKKDNGICYFLTSDTKSGNKYEVHIVNTLKKETIFNIEQDHIKDILYTGNRIFVLSQNKISIYNTEGKPEKNINLTDNLNIIFGNSNSCLYTINKNILKKIKL